MSWLVYLEEVAQNSSFVQDFVISLVYCDLHTVFIDSSEISSGIKLF